MATKKNLKGLSSDNKALDQIADTYPFAKNGIQQKVKGAIINEPGFLTSPAVVPYKTVGIVETDTRPVFFSTNGVNSAIGFYDPVLDLYETILDDSLLTWKLNFKLDKYITGQYQKNHKNQYIIAFTDKINPPRLINCNNPAANKPEDLLLFLRSEVPVMTVNSESGGDLLTGSYFVSIKYAKKDGSETPFLLTSNPVVVSTADGKEVSDKALRIELTQLDTSFELIIIAIISKVKGVTSAIQLDPLPLSNKVTIVYTGNNKTQPITLEEILIKPAVYTRVGTIGQLNDALYIGDLDQAADIDYQKYANLIQIRIKSQLIDLSDKPADLLSGNMKGFMHQEVYAFYIRLRLKDGSRTKAFTIPGIVPTSGDRADVTIGGLTSKTYQLLDTCRNPNTSDNTVSPGVWENTDEVYPDHPSFDSSAIGGPNLRAQKVRHHRMPSLRYCKNTFYSSDPKYGKSKLDLLGIQISGVTIPAELKELIDGYEVLFAKRTIGNSTVLGQSLCIYSAQDAKLVQQNVQERFASSGGNWRTVAEQKRDRDPNNPNDNALWPVSTRLRFYSFDLLFNKPSLPVNCWISPQLKERVNNIRTDGTLSYGVNTDVKRKDRTNSDALPVVYRIDYMSDNAITPVVTSQSDSTRRVDKLQYLPNAINTGEYDNTQLDATVAIKLGVAMPVTAISTQRIPVAEDAYKEEDYFNELIDFEEAYLANLMVLRTNLYDSFYSQTIISTGRFFKANVLVTPTIFAGDSFVNEYSFNTYGWVDTVNFVPSESDTELDGVKVARRFVCEAVSNINNRYEIAGNIYSQWWSHNALGYQTGYLFQLKRSLDPNQFGYSRDLNTLNDLDVIQAFNPNDETITSFPYRIARGGQFKREGLNKSWRTFLPLDYYEAQKNMGRIINLEGMDDRLLIHHENALFITQDKTKLESDLISITLGAGDIFQFQPQEALSSKLGYAGTQHDLACVKTPLGYIFTDNKQGQVFLYKGKLDLINNGLNNFLEKYLNIIEKNPYIGNGVTIGYDPDFNRILLTVKNKHVIDASQSKIVPNYQQTADYFAQLITNQSIVYKDGRYQKFLGINPTMYSCPGLTPPDIGNYTFSIPENSEAGTNIGTVTGTGQTVLGYLIIAGNTNGAFTINSVTGQIQVANRGMMDYEAYPTFTLTIQVKDLNGLTDTGTVIVNLTNVNEPPVLTNYDITIPENTPVNTPVQQLIATDPEGTSLSYSFQVAQNDFSITAAGLIKVLATLSYDVQPIYELPTQVSDGTNISMGTVVIRLLKVNRPPVGTNQSVTILDNRLPGTVLNVSPAIDPDAAEDDTEPLRYSLLAESVPGAFTIDLDPDSSEFLKLKLAVGTVLDPLVTPQYTLTIQVRDHGVPQGIATFVLTANVLYNPATLTTEPGAFNCS